MQGPEAYVTVCSCYKVDILHDEMAYQVCMNRGQDDVMYGTKVVM